MIVTLQFVVTTPSTNQLKLNIKFGVRIDIKIVVLRSIV